MEIEIRRQRRLISRNARLVGSYERCRETTELYLTCYCRSAILDRPRGNVTVIVQILILACRKISYISLAIYKCKFHYARLSRCGRDCVCVPRRMLVTFVKLERRGTWPSALRWQIPLIDSRQASSNERDRPTSGCVITSQRSCKSIKGYISERKSLRL